MRYFRDADVAIDRSEEIVSVKMIIFANDKF